MSKVGWDRGKASALSAWYIRRAAPHLLGLGSPLPPPLLFWRPSELKPTSGLAGTAAAFRSRETGRRGAAIRPVTGLTRPLATSARVSQDRLGRARVCVCVCGGGGLLPGSLSPSVPPSLSPPPCPPQLPGAGQPAPAAPWTWRKVPRAPALGELRAAGGTGAGNGSRGKRRSRTAPPDLGSGWKLPPPPAQLGPRPAVLRAASGRRRGRLRAARA